MSIPLVQEATKDAINTSIIAIKRNIERINMLLGLVDSGSPDLSGLATKQELEDAITQVETDLAPVDEVTSGNMQSVTSNAVNLALYYKVNTNSFYNANTDRENVQNRINAIRQYIPRTLAGIYRIRYYGGYYFSYIAIGDDSEETIIEVSPYNGSICIFTRSGGTVTLTRTI